MTEINRIAKSIEKTIEILSSISEHFSGFSTSDGLGWDLIQAKSMIPDLIKMLPFQEGDRVKLKYNHSCPGAWHECRHFLIKGAKGTVKSIGYYDDTKFFANVVFDNESWIDSKGKIQPVRQKHTFNMKFDILSKI